MSEFDATTEIGLARTELIKFLPAVRGRELDEAEALVFAKWLGDTKVREP